MAFAITRFLLQLIVAMMLLSCKQEKRKHSTVKLIVGLFVGLLISCGFDMSYENPVISRSFAFYAVMLYILALFRLVVKERLASLCFNFVASLVLQDGTFNLYLMAFTVLKLDDTMWQSVFVYITVFAVIYGIFQMVFVRKLNEDREHMIQKNVLFAALFVFIINQLAGSFILVSEDYMWNNMEVRFYNAFCSLMALVIQFGLFQQNRLAQENEKIEQLLHQEYKQRQLSRENVELINEKCHNLKHQIAAIRAKDSSLALEKELRRIENAVMIYDSSFRTQNDALDIVLMEKGLVCDSNHIRLVCIADGMSLSHITDTDIYTLFGNILDNAIDSVRDAEDLEKRYIALEVRQSNGMALIHTENYCEEDLDFQDGLPQTTKEDKRYHGYGMKSIRFLAEKYGGAVSCYQENQLFTLNIMLPLPE